MKVEVSSGQGIPALLINIQTAAAGDQELICGVKFIIRAF